MRVMLNGLMRTLVLCAFCTAQAVAQQPAAEAERIAGQVLADGDWRAEADRCPSQVIRAQEALDHLDGNSCTAGRLESCLSRCRGGEPGACYWLGQALQQTDAHQQAADVLYQQSCKLGVMSGCTNKAASLSKGRQADSSAQACAVETFSKACEFDDPWACTMYALHLSYGIGIKADKAMALRALTKSCKYGAVDPACSRGMDLQRRLIDAKDGALSER